MQTRHIRGIALLAFATTVAAEPPQLAAPPVATAATPAAPATKPPLKLRAGDVRHYMLPGEYREAIEAPDAETTTVVVQGQRLLPMKSLQPIPGGIITPIWALINPHRAWRIFLPDPNSPALGPPDVVPGPIVRPGP